MKKILLTTVVATSILAAPVQAMQAGGAGYERNAFERGWDAFNDFIDRTGSALGDYLGEIGGQPLDKDFNKARRNYVRKHGKKAWYKLSHWETLALAREARSDRLGQATGHVPDNRSVPGDAKTGTAGSTTPHANSK